MGQAAPNSIEEGKERVSNMKRREEGSIVERKKGRKYLIRWRETDPITCLRKRCNKIVKGDYVEAQAELSRKLRPDGKDEAAQPIELTFSHYIERQWAQYVRDNWKGSTQITQGSFVRVYIVPFFGRMLMSRIKPSNVVEFHTAMEAKGLSKNTRKNLHAIVTKMLTYAHDLEIIPSNPVKRGIAAKLEKIEKPALMEDQLYALFSALPPSCAMLQRTTQHQNSARILLLGLVRAVFGLIKALVFFFQQPVDLFD
jgi:hypothetical protein